MPSTHRAALSTPCTCAEYHSQNALSVEAGSGDALLLGDASSGGSVERSSWPLSLTSSAEIDGIEDELRFSDAGEPIG